MPYTWNDKEGCKKQTLIAKEIGVLSKSTVNIEHCDTINKILTPTTEDYNNAVEIIKLYEEDMKNHKAQTDYKGQLIELPIYSRAMKVCERYEKFLLIDKKIKEKKYDNY